MIIDLTLKLAPEMIAQWLATKKQPLIAAGHVGTHLDTYLKTPIPLDYFRCEGVLIDVSHVGNQRDIEPSDFQVAIPENSFVLFRTGYIEQHPYGTPEYFKDHPQLSHALIQYLIDCKVCFVGVDCSGVRQGKEHGEADALLEQNNIYVIENLCNLQQLARIKSDLTVYTMWLDDSIATGLKCRVLVETM